MQNNDGIKELRKKNDVFYCLEQFSEGVIRNKEMNDTSYVSYCSKVEGHYWGAGGGHVTTRTNCID